MRSALTRGWAASLLVSLAALTNPAHAQSDGRAEFDRGVTAMQEERWHDAVEAFRASIAIEPRTTALCNLALAIDRAGGREREAISAYARCAAAPGSERFRSASAARIAELEELLRAREATAAPGDDASGDGGAPRERGEATAASEPNAPSSGETRSVRGDETSPASEDTPIEASDERARTASAPSDPSGLVLGIGAGAGVGGLALLTIGSIVFATREQAFEALAARYPDRVVPERNPDGSPNPDVRVIAEMETQGAVAISAWVIGGALALAGTTLVIVGASGALTPQRDPHVELRLGAGSLTLAGSWR